MNPFYRVDNRLVHGQIISTWLPKLRLQRLLVASDTVPSNALQMTMFRMCVPAPAIFEAMPIAEAAAWLNARRYGKDRVMVLLESVEDAARLFAAGHPFPQLNIGNVHHGSGRKQFTPAVYLDEKDLGLLGGLARRGMRVSIASLPTESPTDLTRMVGG